MYYGNSVCKVLIRSQRHTPFIHSRGKHYFHNKFQSEMMRLCSFFMRNVLFTTKTVRCNGMSSNGIKLFSSHTTLLRYFKQGMSKIPGSLKEHSVHIVKTCTQQCECVVAYRIRRGQQMFSLYTSLWDEVALSALVNRMRQQLSRRVKELLLSAAGVSVYNWEKQRISDDEIKGYMNEFEEVYTLREATVTCSTCHLRQVIDMEVPSVLYCKCPSPSKQYQVGVEWVPFIERDDLLVWRREEQKYSGLYAYKVYGSYNDVTAHDFFQVQIDTEYRKEWDNTAVELQIVESEPNSHSDIIYWEMLWPRMFCNRDYVFNRRYSVDAERKIMLVVNKQTEHPSCPERAANHRVKEYWSYMVIKPYTHFNEPGIEFVLTYFDNPGVSIPSPIASWVAMSGMPDFMSRLREAAREFGVRREAHRATEPEPDLELEPNLEPEPEVEPKPTGEAVHKQPKSPQTASTPMVPEHPDNNNYLQLQSSRLFI